MDGLGEGSPGGSDDVAESGRRIRTLPDGPAWPGQSAAYMVISTATDQLKLRNIMPTQMMTKLRTICSFVIRIPDTRMGRLNSTVCQTEKNNVHTRSDLINRLTPQITGSIQRN